jgi:starvation-inducible DNA-binding protein
MMQITEEVLMSREGDWPAALQATLVELIDLSLQAKHAHWNVVGPGFKPVHEFLDELTGEYRDWSDEVAERLTAIGRVPDGRASTVAEATPLARFPDGPIEDQAALQAFDERVTLVAGNIRRRAEELSEADLASQGLCLEIVLGLEKQRWMLRAHGRSGGHPGPPQTPGSEGRSAMAAGRRSKLVPRNVP